MCCYQTSMLLVAKGIFLRMLNGRERKVYGKALGWEHSQNKGPRMRQ
jgi:hypothetical protein